MTLKELRERKKLSQMQVAEACGFDQTTVSQLELGKVPDPRHSTLQRMADAYGVKLQVVVDALTESLKQAAA